MFKSLKVAAMLATTAGTMAARRAPGVHAASAATQNLKLAGVGSDPVFCVDKAIDREYNAKVAGPTGNHVYNVPPIGGVKLGCGTTVISTTIAAAVYNADMSLIGGPTSGVAAATSICANTYASTLKQYGFNPLIKAKTDQAISRDPAPEQLLPTVLTTG